MSKPSSFEHHQQGDKEICIVRLLFRCDICYNAYVSIEGILNHLDVHEITGGSKELHYQEIKANAKLYQCKLCKDHRAYTESHYRNHLHDVHDDCDEYLCSEKLKSSNYQAGDLSSCSGLKVERKHRTSTESVNQLADGQNEESQEQNQSNGYKLGRNIKESSIIPSITVDSQSNEDADTNEDLEVPVQAESVSEAFSEFPIKWPCSCDICGYILTSYSQAKHHKLTRHGVGSKCPHCSRIFQVNRSFISHVVSCAGRKHSCELCGRKFKNPRGATRHKLRAHKGRKNVCELCGRKFKTPTGVSRHKSHAHKREEASNVAKIDSVDSSADCSGESPVSNLATSDISHDSGLKQTLADSDGNSVSTIEKSSVDQDASKAKILHPNENPVPEFSNTKCLHCMKEFRTEPFLRRHFAQCHVPCVCNICGISFENLCRVRYHKMRMHKEPKLTCPRCPKTFEKSSRYWQHLSVCKEREFSCDKCDQKFKTLNYVRRHKLLYHQGKPVPKKVKKNTSKKVSAETSERVLENAAKRTCPENPTEVTHHLLSTKRTVPNVAIDEHVELEMEIKVEDSMLQEQEHRASDDDRGRSGEPIIYKNPVDTSKHVASEGAYHDDKIQIKLEYVEGEEES